MIKLEAARINDRLHALTEGLRLALTDIGSPSCLTVLERMDQELERRREDPLNIAFVGQYSAGKSTMISGLTGRRDIEIDADIATGRATPYAWKGVRLVDTPGLWTERTDHDAITYDAIRTSDLLVYCLTYMLFDDVTVANFKRLAFEHGLRNRLLLVINKMSSEAGAFDDLVAAYQASLATALEPESLAEFEVVFIDARDYLDGLEEDDPELIEESRFGDLVRSLDRFAARRGATGRLDTPARILLAAVQDAQIGLQRDQGQDDAYLLLLQQMSRAVRAERERLEMKVRGVATEAFDAIVRQGRQLVSDIEGAKDPDEGAAIAKRAEQALEQTLRDHADRLTPLIDQSVTDLQDQLDRVLDGPLARGFSQSVERRTIEADVTSGPGDLAGWKMVQDLGSKGSEGLFKLAGGGADGFLRASGAAGSQLHQGVYAIGKFLGHNFKPWEAVNIAKNLGNVAKGAGVLLSVASLALEVYQYRNERVAEQKAADVRKSIAEQFLSIAQDTEVQFVTFFRREVEPQVFGKAAGILQAARKARMDEIRSASAEHARLAEIEDGIVALREGLEGMG